MNLSCVIVDDEYLAIKVLEEYSTKTEGLSIFRTFKDPKEASHFLQQNKVDLLFLDIQMPYLDGFELLKQLPTPPLIIFTTARHDYAVKAFDLDVLDYLVKPISFDRFSKAIMKANEYYQLREGSKTAKENYIMVRADYQIIKILTEDILFIEGLSEYVKIFTNQKMFISLVALKSILEQLPDTQFVRIHKSYIVALSNIESFNHQTVKLRNGKVLPIGRVYKEGFLKKAES